jgi:hypothetical protein
MSRKHVLATMALAIGLAPLTAALAYDPSAVPSTNDQNRTNGWAHVNEVDEGVGFTTLQFVSTRGFASCFEYRSDGDTTERLVDAAGLARANFNPAIDDGLYPFVCVNNSTAFRTLFASEYVEVRMVFGAESDERFDWTMFDVLPDVTSKDECKDGGWAAFGFRNQGQCVRFIENGGDSR